MVKLLTCDTWITRWDWFDYARRHPEQVPFLLVDRSPCTDPFLDPYASSEERRPIISGLCRVLKQSLQQGNSYIYITRVDHRVCRQLHIPTTDEMHTYLGIAALTVASVHESHAKAAATFGSRRYVVAPVPTLYPPNLAHDLHDLRTRVAVPRESCIVSLKRGEKTVHYTPDRSTDAQWWEQVKFYYKRQKDRQLCAAECRLHQVADCDVLQLEHEHASVFTPTDWGGNPMNIYGIDLPATKAEWFYQQIACGR